MLMGFIAGTYHISFYLSVAAERRSLDLIKENKQEGHSEILLGSDNNIEFLKHFMNILLKILSIET